MSRSVPRVTVECFNCGNKIEKYPQQVSKNKTGRFFCKKACLDAVGRKPRRRKNRECEWCKKEFYPRHGKDDPARFCSIPCYDKWQGRNRVFLECEICGKEFDVPPARAKSDATRFCSRDCMGLGNIKRRLDREHNGKPAVLDNHGYVKVFEPGNAGAYTGWSSWMLEHRLVAEQTLGRRLTTDEHVHHINGNKSDNRPENLAVLSHGEHSSITGLLNGERLREWEEYRRRYGPLND